MATKTSWHRYGTKLRHCHPMYYAKMKYTNYNDLFEGVLSVSALLFHHDHAFETTSTAASVNDLLRELPRFLMTEI